MSGGDRPIRVLHLIDCLDVGGAERVVVNHLRAIDPRRFESLTCYFRHRGVLAEELVQAGLRVRHLRKDVVSSRFGRRLRWLLLPVVALESAVFVLRLARLIRSERIDVVHSHTFSANLWGRIANLLAGRRGMITTEHTKRNRADESVKRIVVNRLLVPLTDRVVAVSEEVAAAVARLQRVPARKLVVVPNGVPLGDGAGSAPRAREAGEAGEVTIAAIGRLAPEKRLDLLLRAVALCRQQVPALRCLLIGGGRELGRLTALTRELGLEAAVEFTGEQRDVRRYFPNLAAVVNSSEREGLPLSLLEALAAGVPVVATDVGGNREIVRDGVTGILVPPDDAPALAAGICAVLADPARARRLAAAGRSLVRERYSQEAATRRYELLYEELATRRRRRA